MRAVSLKMAYTLLVQQQTLLYNLLPFRHGLTTSTCGDAFAATRQGQDSFPIVRGRSLLCFSLTAYTSNITSVFHAQ